PTAKAHPPHPAPPPPPPARASPRRLLPPRPPPGQPLAPPRPGLTAPALHSARALRRSQDSRRPMPHPTRQRLDLAGRCRRGGFLGGGHPGWAGGVFLGRPGGGVTARRGVFRSRCWTYPTLVDTPRLEQ